MTKVHSAQYIDTLPAYHAFLTELYQVNEIALDLEFDRNRYGYGFKLCLIQCRIQSTCYIIDPLLLENNLKEFYTYLEDPKRSIVCFSFGEDFRLLYSLGCNITTVRDLDIGLSLINEAKQSLVNQISSRLGIQTSKSSQTSNWLIRPLSAKQLQYASEDILYLFELRDSIIAELHSKSRYSWFEQENDWAYSVESLPPENLNKITIKPKDLEGLNEIEGYTFKKLFEWRDVQAKNLGKPPFQIIDNHFLKLITQKHALVNGWMNERAVHYSLRNSSIQAAISKLLSSSLEEAITKGLDSTRPANPPLTPDQYETLKRDQNIIKEAKKKVFGTLKDVLVKQYGKNVQSYLLSNRVIQDLALGNANLPSYRLELFKQLSAEYSLEIKSYLG
jgi:ribonuclease D